MSTHNMFSWRFKKDISIFLMKKVPYLLLCNLIRHCFMLKHKREWFSTDRGIALVKIFFFFFFFFFRICIYFHPQHMVIFYLFSFIYFFFFLYIYMCLFLSTAYGIYFFSLMTWVHVGISRPRNSSYYQIHFLEEVRKNIYRHKPFI